MKRNTMMVLILAGVLVVASVITVLIMMQTYVGIISAEKVQLFEEPQWGSAVGGEILRGTRVSISEGQPALLIEGKAAAMVLHRSYLVRDGLLPLEAGTFVGLIQKRSHTYYTALLDFEDAAVVEDGAAAPDGLEVADAGDESVSDDTSAEAAADAPVRKNAVLSSVSGEVTEESIEPVLQWFKVETSEGQTGWITNAGVQRQTMLRTIAAGFASIFSGADDADAVHLMGQGAGIFSSAESFVSVSETRTAEEGAVQQVAFVLDASMAEAVYRALDRKQQELYSAGNDAEAEGIARLQRTFLGPLGNFQNGAALIQSVAFSGAFSQWEAAPLPMAMFTNDTAGYVQYRGEYKLSNLNPTNEYAFLLLMEKTKLLVHDPHAAVLERDGFGDQRSFFVIEDGVEYEPLAVRSVTSSSHLSEANAAEYAFDFDPVSYWAPEAGKAVGEHLKIEFGASREIHQIAFINGTVQYTEEKGDEYLYYQRPSKIAVVYGDKSIELQLMDFKRDFQLFTLLEPITASSVELHIKEVYKGRTNVTPLSAVAFMGKP